MTQKINSPAPAHAAPAAPPPAPAPLARESAEAILEALRRGTGEAVLQARAARGALALQLPRAAGDGAGGGIGSFGA